MGARTCHVSATDAFHQAAQILVGEFMSVSRRERLNVCDAMAVASQRCGTGTKPVPHTPPGL